MARIAIKAPKVVLLWALALISFISPLAESFLTGTVEPFSTYGIVETVVSLVLLFWWYHLDKAEHHYAAGKLMNAGVLVLAVIALPVYFIRSRGWKRGASTIVIALIFLAATFALGEAGEWLGARLAA
jgi:hypothetical protein